MQLHSPVPVWGQLLLCPPPRFIPGCLVTYKGFNLLNHMSRVVYCNIFVAVKLEQLGDVCVKVELCGKNMVLSRFPNIVERNSLYLAGRTLATQLK